MNLLYSGVIYENPLPQLRSRQSLFPFACECRDGSLLAFSYIGEAMESVDGATYVLKSFDGGKTWSEPVPLLDKSQFSTVLTDTLKPTALKDGRIVAIGYAYLRENPDLPEGNPETGGLLDDVILFLESRDNGKTWSKAREIPCSWGPHAEASAPICVLKSGTWITPIAGFPSWDGTLPSPVCGRALRSEDEGKTWNDDAVCMEFPSGAVTCYEQRMCQLESGAILCIAWNEDLVTGERFENHYTVSYDDGKTWSEPRSTGIRGQASSILSLGGEKLLALHAIRRDTENPGIYGYIVDFSDKTWHITEEKLLWKPSLPIRKNEKFADVFSHLKFGQPGGILLQDGDVLMTHWYAEDGEYKTVATRIRP